MSTSWFRRTVGWLGSLTLGLVVLAAPAHAAPSGPLPPYAPPAGLTATEVTFTNGDTTLRGSVVRRADLDPAAARPGIVLVHGSGDAARVTVGQEAEAFARAGIVTLIYDKRDDYSKTNRDLSALADDALAGVRLLRSTPGVDPAKVGLWGLSEGGWVAPLAATRSTDVAYLVTIGASGWNPARTQAWNLTNRLSRAGVSGGTATAIVGSGMGIAIASGLFPASDHGAIAVLPQVRQPVLALWGEYDVQTPPRESAEIFRRELTASPSVTIGILPKGHHAGRVTIDGYERVGGPTLGGMLMGELAPGYADRMTTWIASVTSGTLPAASSDTLPRQRVDSTPVSAAGPLGFTGFFLLLLALLSWPIVAVVRRVRGRRNRPVGAVWARWLAATGLTGVLGAVGYACFVIGGQGKKLDSVVLDQPVTWLVMRLLVLTSLCCAIGLAAAWWRNRAGVTGAHRIRLAVSVASGVLLVPFALVFGLLTF